MEWREKRGGRAGGGGGALGLRHASVAASYLLGSNQVRRPCHRVLVRRYSQSTRIPAGSICGFCVYTCQNNENDMEKVHR